MALEIRLLSFEWEQPLTQFFSTISGSGAEFFHPHPFTGDFAKSLAQYRGKDLYYILVDARTVNAYGMLRGWDEGHEVPSLGIAVHPESRRQGLGEILMHFLHGAARKRKAREIMLKVHKENVSAYALYVKLGYRFSGEVRDGQLVGRLAL